MSTEIHVDALTLRYLELVSGKTGRAAIRAWIQFTGWDQSLRRQGLKQDPVEHRIARARRNARIWWREHGAVMERAS
jgi:hypothetical protein